MDESGELAARSSEGGFEAVSYSVQPFAACEGWSDDDSRCEFFCRAGVVSASRSSYFAAVYSCERSQGERVITVSETSKSEIVRFLKIPSEKVSVTPLGVSASFHPRDHAHVESVLHKYGVDEPYVLTVGARWPRKNVELAIRAMERLSERFPHKLVVAGRMDLSDFGDSKRVVGTGWVGHDDLPALFSRASLYLCPSRHEGFGLPIVEAFASGVPVLSSCGGSLREVGGEAAMYVDDWEVSSWSAAIERCWMIRVS